MCVMDVNIANDSVPTSAPDVNGQTEAEEIINEDSDAIEFALAEQMKLEGNALWKDGKFKEAGVAWRNALKTCYNFSCRGSSSVSQALVFEMEMRLQLNLAACCLEEGDFNRAMDHCSRVLQSRPDDTKALLRMAKAMSALQKWEEAKDILKRILSLNPGQKDAEHLLKVVERDVATHKKQQANLYKQMAAALISSDADTQPKQSIAPPHSNACVKMDCMQRILPVASSFSEDSWIWPVQWTATDFDLSIWQRPHTLRELKKSCNFPLTRALPLTCLAALACVNDILKEPEGKNDPQNLTAKTHAESDEAKHLNQMRALQWPSLRRDILCIHVIGASSHEVSCTFTSILERWPHVKTLLLVFVGFNQNNTKPNAFEEKLEEGKLSPPLLAKSKDGREQVAVLFKGTYAQLSAEVPGILDNPSCTFFPSFAIYSNFNGAKNPREAGETLELLVNYDILTVVTESAIYGAEGSTVFSEMLECVGGCELIAHAHSPFPLLFAPPEFENEAEEISKDWDDEDDQFFNEMQNSTNAHKKPLPDILYAKHANFRVFRGRSATKATPVKGTDE